MEQVVGREEALRDLLGAREHMVTVEYTGKRFPKYRPSTNPSHGDAGRVFRDLRKNPNRYTDGRDSKTPSSKIVTSVLQGFRNVTGTMPQLYQAAVKDPGKTTVYDVISGDLLGWQLKHCGPQVISSGDRDFVLSLAFDDNPEAGKWFLVVQHSLQTVPLHPDEALWKGSTGRDVPIRRTAKDLMQQFYRQTVFHSCMERQSSETHCSKQGLGQGGTTHRWQISGGKTNDNENDIVIGLTRACSIASGTDVNKLPQETQAGKIETYSNEQRKLQDKEERDDSKNKKPEHTDEETEQNIQGLFVVDCSEGQEVPEDVLLPTPGIVLNKKKDKFIALFKLDFVRNGGFATCELTQAG